MNAMGVFLTSDALKNWNFGTWAQRTSGQLWISTIVQRVAPDTLGRFVLLSTVVAGTALASRRYAFPALCAAFAFVLPFLLFTNLHLVHNYYQYANAIFLLAAVGFGLSACLHVDR
jgi:hypothetical protein